MFTLLSLLVLVAWNRVAIFINCLHILVLILFLNHLDVVIQGSIPLHTIPHAIGLIMDIINTIAVDFSTCIDNLATTDPFLVVFLLSDEALHVVYLAKVVHFKSILGIYALIKKQERWLGSKV